MYYKKKVSVVLPVFNCREFIGECITSILMQSYIDFELLIVNDYCTDDTIELVKKFDDSRIRVLDNIGPKGISSSLNLGILNATGQYIARMDSDDISLENRLSKQVEFLDKHSEIGVLGTCFREFGLVDKAVQLPREHNDIAIGLLKGAILCHPSVMIRAGLFENFLYRAEYDSAEDYKLWVDMAIGGVRFHILEDTLVLKRAHDNRISKVERAKQLEISDLVRREYFNYRFSFLSLSEINTICIGSFGNKKVEVVKFNSTLSKIIDFSADKSIARQEVKLIYCDIIYRIDPHFQFKDLFRLMMYTYPYEALRIVDILRLIRRAIFWRHEK